MPPDPAGNLDQAEVERFGRIEARGIDCIPIGERHGRPSELFAVWAASNVTYLYIVLGGALVGLGLNVWQAIGVVFAGNLFWLLVGILSVSGPASGTPSSIVMRAMFGIRGNQVNVALVGCMISVAYEAINLCIGALAAFALLASAGVEPSLGLKAAMVVGIAGVTLTISVYGHATIVRLSGFTTLALTLCVLLLAIFIAPHVNFRYQPANAPHGAALLAACLAGLTIIASGPLSWGTGADYARYLPPQTSARAVIAWTALGGFIPSVLLAILGVLAGTAVDMQNPQISFATMLPAWFYPVFLLVIIAGSTTNNILTAYSSGLALQSVGIKATRAITVLFDGIAGIGLAVYALFVADFVDTLNNILALSVSLLGPSFAIYAADIVLRRNRYDGRDLHDETPQGRFWFNHGVNWNGVSALAAGTGVALLCANTKVLVGPVAKLLDGADISALTGPIVGGGIYAALTLSARRRADVAARKTSVRTCPSC